jgi:hypothetical protein
MADGIYLSVMFRTRSGIAALIITCCLSIVSYASLLAFAPTGRPPARIRSAALPPYTLWAWERLDDLRTINTKRFGVAYLLETIQLAGGLSVIQRKQPLLLPPDAALIAVVRIEAPAGRSDLSDSTLPTKVAEIIATARQIRPASVIQVDFDARQSQREFYRKVLVDLRRRLPEEVPISITALASWCAGDDWISGLPVDEAVPMFFRMGPDHFPSDRPGWSYPIREPLCAGAAGLSTDEAWPRIDLQDRLYFFHPRPWNPVAIQNLELEVRNGRDPS